MGVLVKRFAFGGSSAAALAFVTTCPLASATVGTAYAAAIVASGGKPPYTFTISAGALPGGLSLSSSGIVSGTPTAGGSFSFTIKVVDALSATKLLSCSMTVADFSFADSFQRADQPLYTGTNWATTLDPAIATSITGTQLASCINVTGGNQLHLNNPLGAGTFPVCFMVPLVLPPALFGANQYALCTNVGSNGSAGATARAGPAVLVDANGGTCYVVEFLHDLVPADQWILRRRAGGVDTTIIAAAAGNICSFGQSLKLRVTISGGVPTLTVSVAGVDQANASDSSGSQLTTGWPGLYCEGMTNGIFQDINLYQCGSGTGP